MFAIRKIFYSKVRNPTLLLYIITFIGADLAISKRYLQNDKEQEWKLENGGREQQSKECYLGKREVNPLKLSRFARNETYKREQKEAASYMPTAPKPLFLYSFGASIKHSHQ